jgi:hypothetical protein
MSDFQHKPNSGSVFKNDKKAKDSQPDEKGSALIDGVEYWVSCWVNTTKTGATYRSFKFTPKDENYSQSQSAVPADDIPF